jgi:hypothetical protein
MGASSSPFEYSTCTVVGYYPLVLVRTVQVQVLHVLYSTSNYVLEYCTYRTYNTVLEYYNTQYVILYTYYLFYVLFNSKK